MNLVNDPWIPVIGTDNRPRLASLTDIFQDGDGLADLAANPCQRIALMRLLICIAQAALDGPADEDDWHACRPRLAPAALAYLEKWQHRFNLFGDHAFLQVDGLDPNSNALADKLDFTLACGNNPTLFDHGAIPDGRAQESTRLAVSLLVYQMFSPGGLIGITRWGQQETEKTSEHSPCLEGSMMHAILRGPCLSDTLYLNLLTRRQIALLPNMKWGAPCWEAEALSRIAMADYASSYLGRLVPVPRAIKCESNSHKLVLAAGTRYSKLPEQREPMGTVIEAGTGAGKHLSYLAVKPSKHPWRELGAILALQNSDALGGASCLSHIRNNNAESFDIWTGGLSADKAKLVDMAEWSFTVPKGMLDSLAIARYQMGVESANHGKATLRYAIKTYAEVQKSAPTWQNGAEQCFWSILDSQSTALADCAVQEHDVLSQVWHPIIRSALRIAYTQTCPHETPRQIQAYAQGWKIIESWRGERAHGA